MRILHVASEIFPLIKTGGLADVVAALPPALEKRGLEVRVLLPGFPAVMSRMNALKEVAHIGVIFGATARLLLGKLPDSGISAYVIDAPFFYAREGNPYLNKEGADWSDNHRRFALLGWVAAHIAAGQLDAKWQPEILHAHDWHAGLAPAYLSQNPATKVKSIFTIHNLAFRGIFPMECHSELMLPERHFSPDEMEFHGNLSFLKSALVHADRITTVSPSYSREIRTPEFGCGLDGVLRERANRLSGILNGVDYVIWNPRETFIAKPYDKDNLAGKAACKTALQKEFGLSTKATGPLFAVVSRLTPQKGMDLLLASLPDLLFEGGQLVVLGSGDADLEAGFTAAAKTHPDNIAVHIGYNEDMSHRIMAGSDVFFVPSRFEPCGLTQLYALRYGTLPLVRRVGGLADTVVNADEHRRADKTATGFVFDETSHYALAERIRDAGSLFRDAPAWKEVQIRAMSQNFSWEGAAESYENLYQEVLAK